MQTKIVDTNGVEITAAWRVSEAAVNESHADAVSIALGLYEKMGAEDDSPMSVQITTTWMEDS